MTDAEGSAELPAARGASQQALGNDEGVDTIVALSAQHLSGTKREGVQHSFSVKVPSHRID